MKKTSAKKFLSLFLCVVLAAALALTGCGNAEQPAETTAAAETAAPAETAVPADDVTVKGEGATVFSFVTADLDGKETHFEIHTDKKTVGDALAENELISGTVGDWGLMVDTVNGITLDFEKDGMYWAFYVDGEYAQTGVDSTEIAVGATYSLVPTAG